MDREVITENVDLAASQRFDSDPYDAPYTWGVSDTIETAIIDSPLFATPARILSRLDYEYDET